jgi:Kef-type K+ transport system membrane component KefB/mannitol/fructose-specific phosphotransferase system IIA component (Ntr-type)
MKIKKLLIACFAALTACVVFGHGSNVVSYPNFGMPRVEEMMFLVLQIGVIIFAARLGGAIASALKMPSILGELAAGIVIGPWALGGIGFGDGVFRYGLFNGVALRTINAAASSPASEMMGTIAGNGHVFDATSPALYGIATLASIILLFLSGLETNLKMFLRYSFVGTLVGVGGVVVSFLFGDLCAVYLLPDFFERFKYLSQMPLSQAMTDPAALYMGIMSTATSVGITARILSERKKLDSEEGTTIMAGAVIDDVLGLVVLAIGNGIIAANLASANAGKADGMDWGNIGFVAAKSFGVWLGATVIGVLAARRISKFLKFAFKSPIVIATMAFGLSLILAGFFECMGLAMIIGAYVMGLALSRTDIKHVVQETLTPVYTFLVPIFFCVMGMMVDVSALCSKSVLIFGAVYTILAVFAKVAGCMIPSLCCGFNLVGSLRIGAGMVPRGEVALIIAGLGLSAGYLSQEIFGIGIMMTLITTVVAPPALVGLFNIKKAGVKNPRPSTDGSRTVEFKLADESVAEIMMTKLLTEFRKEGFFVTCLSQSDHIWDVAIDAIEISVRREENKICFECTPAEEAIVMTVWMEVASQINDLARSIAKPTRLEDMSKIVSSTEAAERGREGVAKYVQNFVMLPSFRAESKNDAIAKIVAEIAKEFPNAVKDVKAATEAVIRREESMPTGLDHGIAVPHGRDSSVTGIVGAVAIVDNSNTAGGCIPDYDTIDNSQISIIVLTLAGTEDQTPYLKVMSFISRALRAANGYERLAACSSPDEMRRFFRHAK